MCAYIIRKSKTLMKVNHSNRSLEPCCLLPFFSKRIQIKNVTANQIREVNVFNLPKTFTD